MQKSALHHALIDTADALRSIAKQLNATGSDASLDITGLTDLARQVHRLSEGVITEVTALSQRTGTTTPPETLLAGNGTVPRSQVQAEIDRARVAEAFPVIADSHRSGKAHTGNVDVLARATRGMDPAEVEAMADHDTALADAATRLSEESFRKRVTRLRDKIRDDHGTTAAQQVIDDSFVAVNPTKERDAYRVNGLLDPIRGASVKAAVAREARLLAEDPELGAGLTPAQLAAQALHDLVLRADTVDRMSTPRANVQIHVLSDRDTLERGPHAHTIAETFDGLPIAPATLGRLCCEASMRLVETAADASVNVSRATRSPSAAQRSALRALYSRCPISGAGWESIEIHHVIFYEESRRTVLHELVPISRRWHHVWPAATPSCSLRSQHRGHHRHLSRPDGTPFRTIAPPTPVNQDDHDLAA